MASALAGEGRRPHLVDFSRRLRSRKVSRGQARQTRNDPERMEFLNFVLILWVAWLVWRRPERERRAFGLLVLCCIFMVFLFLVGTHTSLVPGLNL